MDRSTDNRADLRHRNIAGPLITADVAVVGAGPAGLTAALALALDGREVILIGPRTGPADWRTSALLTGSVEFLARLGVWDRLAPRAAALRRIRIVDATQRLIRAPEVIFSADEIDLDAFGYNVRNRDLTSALEERVAECNIRRLDASVATVKSNDPDVIATLSDGTEVRVHLAVAADGRRSPTREAADIAVSEWNYEQAALVANLSHTLAHDDTSTEFHTEHGPFTLVPLGDKQSSLVWVGKPRDHERRMMLSDEAFAAAVEEISQSIVGAIKLASPRQLFPLAGMTAHRFAARRVALVGEAGHVVPPIGAQGLNLGLRDAAMLAEAMVEPGDPGTDERLERYDHSRRFDVVSRTAAIDALNRTVLSDLLPAHILRGLGLFLLDRIPPLRRLAMRQGLATR